MRARTARPNDGNHQTKNDRGQNTHGYPQPKRAAPLAGRSPHPVPLSAALVRAFKAMRRCLPHHVETHVLTQKHGNVLEAGLFRTNVRNGLLERDLKRVGPALQCEVCGLVQADLLGVAVPRRADVDAHPSRHWLVAKSPDRHQNEPYPATQQHGDHHQADGRRQE